MGVTKHIPPHPVIPRDVEEAFLADIAPIEPPPERRDAMCLNILARVRANPTSFVTVRSSDGDWNEIATGVYRKRLVENDVVSAALYRMVPGSSFPAHDHPSDEECFCLQGEVSLGGIVVREGDFHLAPKGLPHGIVTSAEGCLLYIRVVPEGSVA